jgi:hypothetical protein
VVYFSKMKDLNHVVKVHQNYSFLCSLTEIIIK